MGAVLAVANQKGGVGKTTTAVTLGHGLALEGFRVLVVDLDVQGHVAKALGMRKEPGLYRVIALEEAIETQIRQARPGLDILPSDKRTEMAKRILVSMDFKEDVLARKLEPVRELYHLIILDCAPSLDVLHVASLVASDLLLVPTKLDHLALDGVNEVLRSVVQLRQMRGEAPLFVGVLPTFYDRTTRETLVQLKQLIGAFKDKVLPPIPLDTKLREAAAYRKTIWEYAPRSRSVVGFHNSNGNHIGGYKTLVERFKEVLNDWK